MGILSRLSQVLALRRSKEDRDPDVPRVYTPQRTLAGIVITEDNAPDLPAVEACVRYLRQTTAVLPWRVMVERAAGGEVAPSHPIDWLLRKRPNPEWSSFQFRETLTHWALIWGNGYAEIERDQLGRPYAMWPVHPDRVEVCRDKATQELFYEVTNDDGRKVPVASRDMFHIRGFGHNVVGVGAVRHAAQTLGWARAAQLFGAGFFGEGMNISGVVTSKKALKPEGFTRLKAELAQLYKGVRGQRTAILDADMDWKPVQIEPDKAQFIATNQHLVEEVCRVFGVPPHKIAHMLRSTFNNIEHQSIEVVVDSITPWAKRFEDEADFKLFGQNRQGFYTKMNLNGLMRGDAKARMEFYRGMREIAAFSVNDILRLEDMNTIGPEGEKRVMQSQYTTIERIGEDPQPVAEPAQSAAIERQSPDEDTQEDDMDALATAERILATLKEPAHAE